jgi:hypothetical protein
MKESDAHLRAEVLYYMDRILRYRATSGPIANAIAAMTTIETPVAM